MPEEEATLLGEIKSEIESEIKLPQDAELEIHE